MTALNEKALEAAVTTFAEHSTTGRGSSADYHALIGGRLAPSITAYFASLAEQGIVLVDVREVIAFVLQHPVGPQGRGAWAAAIEARFAPEARDDA